MRIRILSPEPLSAKRGSIKIGFGVGKGARKGCFDEGEGGKGEGGRGKGEGERGPGAREAT